MILGVTDKRPRKVVGTSAFLQPERTRKGLCERTRLLITFDEITHSDGRVLVFYVPSRPVGAAVKDEGVYWSREEDSLVPLSEERLREIFAEGGKDFSAEICAELTMDDLNLSTVENFRRLWVEKSIKGQDFDFAGRLQTLSAQEFLTDAEAMIDGQLTYASLILFGLREAVKKRLAQAEVIFEYRSSDASGAAQVRHEYTEGFFAVYETLWDQINLRNEKQEFQEGFFVHPISTFSERPVREIILNAICHRDYQLGGSIFIRQYPRRLEVDSPGGLPSGITLENILDRHKSRNRRIAEIFQRCGFVERSGQGMNLIFEESIRQGKPIPDFSRTDSYQVGITLFGNIQNPHFVRFVEKVGNETAATFGTRDWLLLDTVSREMSVPEELVDRCKRLEELGLIERIRGRKFILSRRYYEFVGKKGAYTRKRGLDREQNIALLLNHIRQNASQGSKLQELCEVVPALLPTYVQSLLRTLKRRGQIYPNGITNSARWFPATKED